MHNSLISDFLWKYTLIEGGNQPYLTDIFLSNVMKTQRIWNRINFDKFLFIGENGIIPIECWYYADMRVVEVICL